MFYRKMKFLKVTALLCILCFNGMAQNQGLIVYFSHTGNTEVIASYIHELTDLDVFRIEPVEEYPTVYREVADQAKKEIRTGYHPMLKSKIENFEQYDTIFVGSPNWWSTIAPPVATILTSYDFKGKTIIPFMTHGGGKFGRSIDDIKELCPEAVLLNGYECPGNIVFDAREDVKVWLKKIKLIK